MKGSRLMSWVLAALLTFAGGAGGSSAWSQSMPRPGVAPDPIDQARGTATRPVPTLPAPDQPAERLVPERRLRDPGTGKEIVIPPHYERRITDQQSQVPPLTGYGARGEGTIIHIPGGERPPAELRQSP